MMNLKYFFVGCNMILYLRAYFGFYHVLITCLIGFDTAHQHKKELIRSQCNI